MSATGRTLLIRVQEDAYSRILAHPHFADVAVILEKRAQTVQEIQKQLGTLKGRSGKVGAAIFVQRPVFYPAADDPGGRGQLVQAFTCVEHPTLNYGDLGTRKTAEELALELFDLFHFVAASLPSTVFSGFPGGAVVPDDTFEGFNAWETRLQLPCSGALSDRCGTPLIDPEEGAGTQEITLTCGTTGAELWYTLDGSYPSSRNESAQKYLAPIVPGAGALLRVAAEKEDYIQSSLAEAQFT